MESRCIWLNTIMPLYPSRGQALYFGLLTFSPGRGIILVACEMKLSSQRNFPSLTCPGPGLLSVDLGDKRNGLLESI